MITVDIPITDRKSPPRLIFPDRCVSFGKPKERCLPGKLSTGVQKRGQMVHLEMEVPLCKDCLAKENKIGNVTWIPFFVTGLLVGVTLFVPVWLVAPAGISQASLFPYVLGGFIGMLAPFLWIRDLSAKDPIYLSPIVMGASMFLQQKMTPTTADQAQAKMFMFMPILFTFFFHNFPSGLVLYWLINNVLSIAHQYYMNKRG